jgi:hypothetical protein
VPKAPSVSLTKIIEATKLHPRTGLSLGLPPVTVPYGALVEPVGSERDRERFMYLSELFECSRELFQSATGGTSVSIAEMAEPEPVPIVERAPEPAPATGPRLEWDRVNSSSYSVTRAAVPGGWLVTLNGSGLTFVPDLKHKWNGGSAK